MLAEAEQRYGIWRRFSEPQLHMVHNEPCPHNPILTHRMTAERNFLYGTWRSGGRSERKLVDGLPWNPLLHGAYAPLMQHHLGRETFLAPVMWDKDGWPKVGENGKISPVMDGPLPAPGQSGKQDEFVDCFEEKNFDLCYNFLRNPQMEQYVRDSQHGELLLKGNGISLNDGKNPTWSWNPAARI